MPDFNLQDLAEPLHEPVGDYARRLVELCGRRLSSITFYGPQPGEESRLSNVALFDAIDLGLLRLIADQGARFGRSGIVAPWVLTPSLLDSSRDTFPLELIEISQHHTTIYGDDVFAALEFDAAHVRLQAERELRVIEIHLQRGVLATAGDERQLGRLGRHLATTMLRILRGLLWLHGQRAYLPTYDLLSAVEKSLNRPLPGVQRSLDEADTAVWSKFSDLYSDVRALVDFADRLS